ncbi:MAG: ComE operon protein 3 [Verrucomicrobiae bacterium]|nr:ComE operon protein 3 [Verrucomicrobiae bacterium]
MKRPFTGLVVTYASGILVGSWTGWPLLGLGLATATLVGLFFLARRPAFLWLAVFCAGMWAVRFATTNFAPDHLTRLVPARTQNIGLRGVIVSDPNQRASFKLRVEALQRWDQTKWEPASGTVMLFVSEAREPMSLNYGDELECTALLRVPTPASNPGTFDWQRWLARQNIQFSGLIRKADVCEVRAGNRGHPVIALALRLREHFERPLHVGLEDQPRLAGVLAGMVIGERSEIPPDTYARFQQTGVFHVFAISGLHVGIVTLVIVTGLRLVRVPRRWCALLAIPALVLYVYATGARPGAVRALVMACVWLGGWLLVRPADSLNNLAAAALIILVAQPTQLFEGGFLLSFGVVLALLVVAPRIEKFFLPGIATDPLLPGALVPGWRRALVGPLRWFVQLVSCSLAAWVGLVPLMAEYFNLFTPISIVANVVVIPLVSLIIPIGMLSLAIPGAAEILNNANYFLLQAMIQSVDWLGQVRWGHWFVQAPPVWLSVGFYGILGAHLAGWLRLRWLALFAIGVLTVAAWPRASAEITVLDLPDGDAIFVNVPGEKHDFLINGGCERSGTRIVLPYLRAQGVDRLAAVVLTRADKAHAGGLQVVTKQMPVPQALHAGTGSRSKFFWEWLNDVRRQEMEIVALRAGDSRQFGQMQVRALHPPPGRHFDRSDDNSLVLLLEFAGTRVLVTSDIGEKVEKNLIDIPADVLIKGRHGVEASGTEAFLESVQPAVVIQAGGSRHQPVDELPERLRDRAIQFYRTEESGAVTVRLTTDGYTIRTCFTPAGTAR